jgi:Tol biopolymer transport system component
MSKLFRLTALATLTAALVLPPIASASPVSTLATFEMLKRLPSEQEASVENTEVALSTLAENGGFPHRLLAVPFEVGDTLVPDFFGGVSFSPDGTEIAFTAAAEPEKAGSKAIYLIGSDGSGLRRLPGTAGAEDPHFSPDGTTLAFARSRFRTPKINWKKPLAPLGKGYSSTTTWLLDLATGKAQRLTPWRNGLSVEPGSFSPDGATIVLTRADQHRRRSEILLWRLGRGPTRVLTQVGEEPDFSPDGSRIVFVGYQHPVHVEAEENQGYYIGDLYSIGVDGKDLRRLTDNKAIETSPVWDPSGTRLAYVEAKPDRSWLPGASNLFPTGNRIREMNADGTCARTIRSAPKVGLYDVAWSPGATPAGPLGC